MFNNLDNVIIDSGTFRSIEGSLYQFNGPMTSFPGAVVYDRASGILDVEEVKRLTMAARADLEMNRIGRAMVSSSSSIPTIGNVDCNRMDVFGTVMAEQFGTCMGQATNQTNVNEELDEERKRAFDILMPLAFGTTFQGSQLIKTPGRDDYMRIGGKIKQYEVGKDGMTTLKSEFDYRKMINVGESSERRHIGSGTGY